MQEIELLHAIRSIWLHRVTLNLARDANIREDVRAQLEHFFALIEQAVDTGDASWVDPVLSTWATSLTQTDLESNTSNLSLFIREIMQNTYDICRETLEGAQAVDLLGALLPVFAHCFEKASQYEMQVRVAYVSNQLKQVQGTLERLDRSKSDFIAIAAHELKTPLTLIEGYTAMMRDAREPSSPPPFELELLDGINNGTRRLKTIIDDMIDVSLIDNNLLALNFQPVWINRLLAVLQTELAPAVTERRQKMDIRPFTGSADMTFGDPERLLQALRNVRSNAVKYTPDGGCITVDGRKLPGFIEVIVRDTGIGIDPEDQSIIFDKFTRLGNIAHHSSGKTKFKGGGPGLGLHIARGIIESHGGAIWVESPGYDEKNLPGSVFHVLIPHRLSPPDDKMSRLLAPLTEQ